MNYQISNLPIKNGKTLSISTPNYTAFFDTPEIIKGFGENPDEDVMLDIAINKIFQNSDMKEQGLVAEDLLELNERDIVELFQKFVFGAYETTEIEEVENVKVIKCKTLDGAEIELKAKRANALLTRKYRNFTNKIKAKKPSQKDMEGFFYGAFNLIFECLIEPKITLEELKNGLSIASITGIFSAINESNFTRAEITAV